MPATPVRGRLVMDARAASTAGAFGGNMNAAETECSNG